MRGQLRSANGSDFVAREHYERVTSMRLTREVIRLLPYIQYVLMNNQVFDISKITLEENAIIQELKTKGCLFDHNGHIHCTLEFWTVINEVLYLAYVDYEEE